MLLPSQQELRWTTWHCCCTTKKSPVRLRYTVAQSTRDLLDYVKLLLPNQKELWYVRLHDIGVAQSNSAPLGYVILLTNKKSPIKLRVTVAAQSKRATKYARLRNVVAAHSKWALLAAAQPTRAPLQRAIIAGQSIRALLDYLILLLPNQK